MSENEKTEKREITYHAPVREFDNNKVIITAIGFGTKPDEKYEIVWDVPETDEESQARYDCPLKTLIEAGVRQFSTRPNYKDVGFEEDGSLKPEGHEAMQTLADGYRVGQRAVGTSQKAVVQKVKKTEKELGMTLDEMAETIAKMKEQGLLD